MQFDHTMLSSHLFNSGFVRTGLLLLAGMAAGTVPAAAAPPAGYTLTWSDEFKQAAGTPPDKAHWSYDTGSSGWGNNELENYVSDIEHAHVVADPKATDGKALQILITYNGQGLEHGNFESARLLTQGKITAQYGYIEARVRMPAGQGLWPAFWMLGSNLSEPGSGWPNCGEIDIMENMGSKPGWNASSLHGPGYSGGNPLTGQFNLPAGQEFNRAYHTFGLLWKPDFIQFSVDGTPFETRTPADIPGKTWVYNHPFFFVLNAAVGGNFGGNPDTTSQFPQKMLVDYIRLYQAKP